MNPTGKRGGAKPAVGEKVAFESHAYTGGAKPAVGEKLAQTHQLKVEEPSQLSERTFPTTTS